MRNAYATTVSGKSFIRKPIDLLLTPINEQDQIEREKEQLFREQQRAAKNSKNQMEQELMANIETMAGERGAASSLLGLLDNEFSTGDLIKLRAKKGQSVSSASVNMLLCRWKKMGRIDKTGEGKWKRLS